MNPPRQWIKQNRKFLRCVALLRKYLKPNRPIPKLRVVGSTKKHK